LDEGFTIFEEATTMLTAQSQQPILPPPDDALSAIFALARHHLDPNKRFAFRAHDSQLQEIFRELADQYDLLPKIFVFSSSGPRPYSPALNDSIAKLQLTGLVGRENPDYQVIFLRPAAEGYFQNVLAPKLGSELIERLDRVASDLITKLHFV
jgi:hypothetical protein